MTAPTYWQFDGELIGVEICIEAPSQSEARSMLAAAFAADVMRAEVKRIDRDEVSSLFVSPDLSRFTVPSRRKASRP